MEDQGVFGEGTDGWMTGRMDEWMKGQVIERWIWIYRWIVKFGMGRWMDRWVEESIVR